MSVLQMKHNEIKLFESEKCIDEEYTVASRETSRLPPNFIQYWVDTGHLPPQFRINAVVHSDAGSSLSEEGSLHKQYTICNTVLKDKLNDKQLCNNGSSNSSVDTAAYVLSNTNVTKKENIYSRFFKKDEALKIHQDMNYENNKSDTAGNICDTIDSNISNKKYAFDMYSSNEIYQKDKELEGINIIERSGLKSPTSFKEDIAEISKNDNQISEGDLNCQSKEFVENSIEEAENTTNVNKNSTLFEDTHNDSVRHIRQKKLYVGRESPIDINMCVMSKSVDTGINEEKRNLHPAYRNSPHHQTSYKKYLPKKRKYNFFLKNSKNKSQEDTSSNNSTNDNIDVETSHAKRRKSLEDLNNHVNETQFFSTASQMSRKNKLRQSCLEMEKQIKRFPTSEFIRSNELKQLNDNHISQSNTKFYKKNLRCGYGLRSRAQVEGKKIEEKTNVRTVSYNTLNKKRKPIVLLERLSEKVIKQYTSRRGLQSEETGKNSVPIKNMVKGTNKRNYRACSIMSKNTEPCIQLKNTIVHSENSDATTIIINNNMNSQSTNRNDSNNSGIILNSMSLPNSGNTEKNQSETFSNDAKLMQMRPVVLLEQLHYNESYTKKPLCTLNNLKNKLQPIVVLERLINIDRNSNYSINTFTYNEFNKTKAREMESREINKGAGHSYEHSTKLLYFKTNMSSDLDSDSDESSTKCTFNLNTYMKHNSENKTINQKSFKSLSINMPEDFKNTKSKKGSSKRKKCSNEHMKMHDSNEHMSIDSEHSILENVSCMQTEGNSLYNFNKSGNNQKAHALGNIQLRSDTSEKEKSILKNGVKDTVIIDLNKENKRNNKLVFVTKVYDSDSD